jgi:Zn-dependent alcohol dehydrogenase
MIIGVDINNEKKKWDERFGMIHFVNPKDRLGPQTTAERSNCER